MNIRRALLVALVSVTACGSGNPAPSPVPSPDTIGYEADAAPEPSEGAAPWPAPDDPLRRARQAALVPAPTESFRYHIHSHLDVFVNGDPVDVPPALGIDTTDPDVDRLDQPDGSVAFSGIDRCGRACVSPLHTHDRSGIIHVEAPEEQPFRLGQVFIEWGVRLDQKCVGGYCRPEAPIAVFVDGARHRGDPALIALEDHQEIAIVIGSPPEEIPVSFPTA